MVNATIAEVVELHKTDNMAAEHPTRDFYIGLGFAILSNSLIGSSLVVKKKGLLRLTVRAGKFCHLQFKQ